MNNPSTQNKDPACSAYADQGECGMKPLTLDPDEYREYLAEFDLTKDQQDELLEVLWNILRTFVEIGFGLDSVQVFSTAKNGRPDEITGPDSGKLLGVEGTPQHFNEAADRSGRKET